MALVPIRIDRTSKPPIGTPLRSDGHWSVEGIVGAWAFNEGSNSKTIVSFDNENVPISYAEINVYGLSILSAGYYQDIISQLSPKMGKISSQVSIYIGYKKRDTTLRPSAGFGIRAVGDAQRCGVHIPWEDGKIYWDFGGVTEWVNRLSVALSGWGQYHDFSFNSGPRGMEIWSNATKIASNTASPVRDIAAIGPFALGAHTGSGSDLADYHYFLMYQVQHLPQQIASLSANPWQIYEPETVWIEVGGGGEIFSGTFGTSLENLIQSGVGQIGCGGGITANAGSAAYSMGGLEGKQGGLSINISDLLQLLSGTLGNVANLQSTITALPFLLSGNSGNSANFNSQLLSLTQSLNGQHGVSAALIASIGNLSAMFGEQVVFQGTVSAVTATFVSSISGITGNIGQALASISVASVISGITGNSGLIQGALDQISGQWIGNVGVSGSALMYVSTGAEMVGKLGVSASIASELNAIGAYLVEIITGGKIDRIVISTKTGSAVILTATGKINITTN